MRRVLALLIAGLALGGCGLSARAGGAGPQLVAAVRSDAPPFGWRDGAAEPLAGFDVDLARAIVRQLHGEDATLRFIPPAAGAEADLVMGRPPGAGTTRAYLEQPLALLVKQGSPVGGLADLDGRQLALVSDVPQAAPQVAGVRYVPALFSTYPLALAAVGQGRAEALAGELPVLRALAALDPNRRIVASGYGRIAYAIAAPARLLPSVDAALGRLMADPNFWPPLLHRWGLDSRRGGGGTTRQAP